MVNSHFSMSDIATATPPRSGAVGTMAGQSAQRGSCTTTLILDGRGTIRFCGNPRLFGGHRDEIEDQPIATFIPSLALPDTAPGRGAAACLGDYALQWQRHLLRARDGRSLEVEISLRQLALDGEVAVLLMLRAPRDARAAQRGIETLLASAAHRAEAVCVTDYFGCIVFVNRAFERLTGYSAAEACGTTQAAFRTDHRDPPLSHDMWATLLDGHELRAVFGNRTKDGDAYLEEQYIRPFIGDDRRISHFVATCRKVSGDTADVRIETSAVHRDALTGLPNPSLSDDSGVSPYADTPRRAT
jgi:PAS domain S-box-containing protein